MLQLGNSNQRAPTTSHLYTHGNPCYIADKKWTRGSVFPYSIGSASEVSGFLKQEIHCVPVPPPSHTASPAISVRQMTVLACRQNHCLHTQGLSRWRCISLAEEGPSDDEWACSLARHGWGGSGASLEGRQACSMGNTTAKGHQGSSTMR